MKTLCVTVVALAGVCAFAQQVVPITSLQPVVPAKVLTRQAAERPHVLFLNVAKAVNDELFREAVAAVSLVVQVNLEATSIPGPLEREALWERGYTAKRYGDKAKLIVYVKNDPKEVSFINAPGNWAVVNLSGLDRDKPDTERYRRRLRQMMLKGLAHACGVGATGDSHCVMYNNSFTLEGMDKTSVSYSPFAGAPVQDTLLAIGGISMFGQAQE